MQEEQKDKKTPSDPPRRNKRPPAERESIWSVPRRLRAWYAGIFVTEYLLFLALTIWDEVVYQTGDNAVQTILAVQRGMSQNLLQIAGSAYVILEVYMLAEWLRERDQRREQAAVERAEAEAQRAEAEAQRAEQAEAALQKALREARREANHQWRAWYWRQRAAIQDGRPFDEPPPGGPPGENGADEP